MPREKLRGVRELPLAGAEDLAGAWVSSSWADGLIAPPSPLARQLIEDDAILLGEALAQRGASLSRLARRFARIEGYAYHDFVPLARAVHEVFPLDAQAFALAGAGEAYVGEEGLAAAGARLSRLTRAELTLRSKSAALKLERHIWGHERDAEQHYRWLIEMDLGILPDDALGTTLEECLAVQRTTRRLEIEVTLEVLGSFAALLSYAERQGTPREALSMAALAPDPLELPSATPALAFGAAARALFEGALGSDASPFALFLESFGERGPSEAEPLAPRWREDPARLTRLAELLGRARFEASDRRLAAARRARENLLGMALSRANSVDRALLRTLLLTTKRLVLLRSRLHRVRARTLSMLRTAVLDVDRRLGRLIGSNANDAFFLEPAELLVSTVRPRRELAALAVERRRVWTSRREHAAPPALVGRDARSRARALGSTQGSPSAERELHVTGIGASPGAPEDVAGPVFIAKDFDTALAMPPHAVLVLRALDAGWAPLLLGASAVVTDSGGLLDEGAITAAALGVPMVIGTRDATLRLTPGARVSVNVRAGRVTLVDAGSA